MIQDANPVDADGAEYAARIIGALGQLMSDFHARDLAVQNAVSEMTCSPDAIGLNMTDLQHIDLVTQTHADLAKFLAGLAKGLRENDVADHRLAGTLTLRSLQDALLRPPEDLAAPEETDETDVDAGDILLF